jgi:hypothetical protein
VYTTLYFSDFNKIRENRWRDVHSFLKGVRGKWIYMHARDMKADETAEIEGVNAFSSTKLCVVLLYDLNATCFG